jgi:cytoskeletal protein RodZ
MRKLFSKKVLLWTTGIVGVLIIGFLVTMNYATDYLLRSIISSSQVQESSSDILERSSQQSVSSAPTDKSTINDTNNQSSSLDRSSSAQSVSTGTATPASPIPQQSVAPTNQNTDFKGSTPTPSDTKLPVNSPSSTSSSPKGYDGNITPDKAEQVQESISLKEKAIVSSVLLKKLSSSDISLFVKMSGDGVTVEEKKQAKKVILEKLTEDEYNELIAIAAKLGLSSGRGYQETQKDYETK